MSYWEKTFLMPRPSDWMSSPIPRMVAHAAVQKSRTPRSSHAAPRTYGDRILSNLLGLSGYRAPDPWNSSCPRTIPGVMK